MRRLLLVLAFAPFAGPSLAQSPPTTLSCDGPFARDSDHARLVKIFGAANVVFTKIPGPEEIGRAHV